METIGNQSGSISEDTDNKPGATVSLDQLQSDQPGLVPKLSRKLTIAHTWVSQVRVHHFSNLTYLHLMISTTQ